MNQVASDEKIEMCTDNDGRKVITIAYLTQRGSDELIQVDSQKQHEKFL